MSVPEEDSEGLVPDSSNRDLFCLPVLVLTLDEMIQHEYLAAWIRTAHCEAMDMYLGTTQTLLSVLFYKEFLQCRTVTV